MQTWTLIDRGYDCDRHGQPWDCTAESFIAAVRMLDGFARAAYAQPINDVRGCSTVAVYRRISRAPDSYSKIGVVYVARVRDAELTA